LTLLLSGGVNNTDPLQSIGGQVSFRTVGSNFFTPIEIPLVGEEYDFRCFYVRNESDRAIPELTIYINSEVPQGCDVELGIGAEVNGTAFQLLSAESIPPSVTFAKPSPSSPLTVADLEPSNTVPIWVKRIITSTARPLQADGFVIAFSGGYDCICEVDCEAAFNNAWSFGFNRCS
jgi:hypothetical protein